MPIILMGDWLAPPRPPDPASASAHPRAITKERCDDGWAGAGAGAGATSVIRARASDTSTVQYSTCWPRSSFRFHLNRSYLVLVYSSNEK